MACPPLLQLRSGLLWVACPPPPPPPPSLTAARLPPLAPPAALQQQQQPAMGDEPGRERSVDDYDVLMKVVLIGDSGVGKTK